jgi:hypothetical protein
MAISAISSVNGSAAFAIPQRERTDFQHILTVVCINIRKALQRNQELLTGFWIVNRPSQTQITIVRASIDNAAGVELALKWRRPRLPFLRVGRHAGQ